MKSVRETIASGITTLAELQAALQTAIQLEFSTIPPYLCAQWSIDPSQDPNDVTQMIEDVVLQEMLHFGFACNMLSAIGGTPEIASATFVPTYPADGLPGNVQPGLIVNLLPCGYQALNTFMEIEFPETGAIVSDPDSIGAFYDTIAAGFNTVQPAFPSGTHQPVLTVNGDHLTAIASVADAVNAITEIKDQGEGTSSSPDQGTFDPTELAHYYTYAQIYYGNQLAEVNGQYTFTGAAIKMPAVYNFAPPSGQPNSSQTVFAQTFTSLMNALQQCWTSGAPIGSALGTMATLGQAGQSCIKQGFTPLFLYQAS